MAQELGRLDAAVAGDDPAVGVDQHRVGEAELANAIGDLPQLPVGMSAWVAGGRLEGGDQPRRNVQVVLYHLYFLSDYAPLRG